MKLLKEVTLLIFSISCSICFAQDFKQQNLQKYWDYHKRLNDGFVIIGDCDGCSLPAGSRDYHSSDPSDPLMQNKYHLSYNDETIMLGYYIAVLATEVGLLQQLINYSNKN